MQNQKIIKVKAIDGNISCSHEILSKIPYFQNKIPRLENLENNYKPIFIPISKERAASFIEFVAGDKSKFEAFTWSFMMQKSLIFHDEFDEEFQPKQEVNFTLGGRSFSVKMIKKSGYLTNIFKTNYLSPQLDSLGINISTFEKLYEILSCAAYGKRIFVPANSAGIIATPAKSISGYIDICKEFNITFDGCGKCGEHGLCVHRF